MGVVTILASIQLGFFALSMIATVAAITAGWRSEVTVSIRSRPLCTVAFPAWNTGMATRQRPARGFMIERSPVELGNPVTTPAMFAMAVMTFGTGCVTPMIAFSSTDPLANSLVAIETVSIGHTTKDVMALRAIVVVVISRMRRR